MINTWCTDVTIEAIEKAKNAFQEEVKRNPASVVISRFRDDFRISFVYNSNAMEGNTISEYDTAHIIRSNSFLEGYSAKENMEVIGSANAWDYILTLPPVSQETVLEIHKRILFFDVDHAGVYRKTPVRIGEKQMLAPEAIVEAMSNLFPFTTNQKNPFEAIAESHLKFENIHPFIDGDGRTGRVLLNLQLLHSGYLPINIKQNDSGKYYRCFRQYDLKRDKGIQEMFNLITKYEYEELNRLNDMILENRQDKQ